MYFLTSNNELFYDHLPELLIKEVSQQNQFYPLDLSTQSFEEELQLKLLHTTEFINTYFISLEAEECRNILKAVKFIIYTQKVM